MTDLVFLDTETLGLDPDAPVWEFAAVRRLDPVGEVKVEFTIHHNPAHWLDDFPEAFLADYLNRFNPYDAWCETVAARTIHRITKGAHIVGAVPSFDTERLAKLLRRNGIEPEWHYHLIDVENIVVGYLAGRGELIPPPWKSDQLSAAVGVNPDDYNRHTAMGDVLWSMSQWDAVMAETPSDGTVWFDGAWVRFGDEDTAINPSDPDQLRRYAAMLLAVAANATRQQVTDA